MTNPDNVGWLPLLQFAVFDEFGKGADDRVWDYGRRCFEAGMKFEGEHGLMTTNAPKRDSAPAGGEPNGKLVGWWNGITPGFDGMGMPSIRWGADAEDSGHDIPLYDGYNPIHYVTPVSATAGSGEVHPIPQELFDRAHRLRELAAANRLNECLPTIETMCGKNAGDAIRDAAALLRKLQQGEGYVMVPREPSNAMVLAAIDRDDSAEDASPDGMYVGIYRAMVDASDRGAK